MQEEWKQIKGYEGYYEISNLGRVKSIIRNPIRSRNRPTTKKENILKGSPNNSGYPSVTLTVDWKPKQLLIHRLVAIHFIPNPNNYNVINHLDGNKTNFSISNLEWTTSSLNQKHAYDTGLKRKKLSVKQKLEILQFRKEGLTYYQIADKYNVSYQIIGKICKLNQKSLTIQLR